MFGDFFTYFTTLFVSIVLFLLFSKAWSKRDIVKNIYSQTNIQYGKNVALAKPNNQINFIPVFINIMLAGYNLKLFFTDFCPNPKMFFVFWVSFFLLLLNIPLFIYKEKDGKTNSKSVAVFMFLCISLFCFPALYFYHGSDLINLIVGWLYNYITLLFFSNEKVLDNVKGKTVFFMLFWVFVLVMSIIISANFSLPKEYNYGYLISTTYFFMYAYFNYFSDKYEKINSK
jgi:hypothetical protein